MERYLLGVIQRFSLGRVTTDAQARNVLIIGALLILFLSIFSIVMTSNESPPPDKVIHSGSPAEKRK